MPLSLHLLIQLSANSSALSDMMSAGKSYVCAAALLCLNLLVLGAQAKHGDGYEQPLAKNANWLFYS
jgi:hypothetical protein